MYDFQKKMVYLIPSLRFEYSSAMCIGHLSCMKLSNDGAVLQSTEHVANSKVGPTVEGILFGFYL